MSNDLPETPCAIFTICLLFNEDTHLIVHDKFISSTFTLNLVFEGVHKLCICFVAIDADESGCASNKDLSTRCSFQCSNIRLHHIGRNRLMASEHVCHQILGTLGVNDVGRRRYRTIVVSGAIKSVLDNFDGLLKEEPLVGSYSWGRGRASL